MGDSSPIDQIVMHYKKVLYSSTDPEAIRTKQYEV